MWFPLVDRSGMIEFRIVFAFLDQRFLLFVAKKLLLPRKIFGAGHGSTKFKLLRVTGPLGFDRVCLSVPPKPFGGCNSHFFSIGQWLIDTSFAVMGRHFFIEVIIYPAFTNYSFDTSFKSPMFMKTKFLPCFALAVRKMGDNRAVVRTYES